MPAATALHFSHAAAGGRSGSSSMRSSHPFMWVGACRQLGSAVSANGSWTLASLLAVLAVAGLAARVAGRLTNRSVPELIVLLDESAKFLRPLARTPTCGRAAGRGDGRGSQVSAHHRAAGVPTAGTPELADARRAAPSMVCARGLRCCTAELPRRPACLRARLTHRPSPPPHTGSIR